MASFIITMLFSMTILYSVPLSLTVNPLPLMLHNSFHLIDPLLGLQPFQNIDTPEAVDSESSISNNLFARHLLPLIADAKPTQNIVYSPASIFTSLALVYLGAEGGTADELRKVLELGEENKIDFASKYGNILKTTFNQSKADKNAPQLSMASRLYVSNKIKVKPQFNKVALENLGGTAENVNFSQALTATEKINKWVEQETANKIKNLLQPHVIDGDTNAILVNAIYFMAKWLNPFSKAYTHSSYFHLSRGKKIMVDTMYMEAHLRYAKLPHLKSVAVELPYKNSNMSMLIIMPYHIEGLQKLEKKLKHMDLNELSSQLEVQKLDVFLPKFRIEADIDLKKPLENMGISSMFGPNANLTGMFESAVAQKISDIKHKAYLDCNEGGSEAAASTYMKIMSRNFDYSKKLLRINRPFVFFIRSKSSVLFAGHVATLE